MDGAIRNFCSAADLEEYKMMNCLWCQSAGPGINGKIGKDKSQTRTFCNQDCFSEYSIEVGRKPASSKKRPCDVCSEVKKINVELFTVSDTNEEEIIEFCSDPCMSAFKYSQSLNTLPCDLCKKHFVLSKAPTSGLDLAGQVKLFCNHKCQEFFCIERVNLVNCQWCKFSKSDVAMISYFKKQDGAEKSSKKVYFCSTNCLYMNKLSPSIEANNGKVKEEKKKVVLRNKGIQTRQYVANKGKKN